MSKPIRIGVAGLGTVGVGVVRILQENASLLTERSGVEIEIVAVSARSDKDRGVDLSAVRFESDARTIAAAEDVDIVVEVIGGDEGIARELVEQALTNGKHVVTANKALIAKHGTALSKLAEQNGVALYCEAAVAGGTPILGMIRDGLNANHISRVSGILNGTCNFILTQMEDTGRDYADIFAEADRLGYLEADPRLDVDGIDTAHKLAILAALAFGKQPNMDGVVCEGISRISAEDIRYTRDLGYRIKLLGVTEKQGDKVVQHVSPMLVPHDAPMASVGSSYNAIEVHGDHVERIFLTGRGAGPGPTASAVVADLVAVARGERTPTFGVKAEHVPPMTQGSLDALNGHYYLRLKVKDEPGVLAKITELCSSHGISVEELRQHPHADANTADIVTITHKADEGEARALRDSRAALEVMVEEPMILRVQEA